MAPGWTASAGCLRTSPCGAAWSTRAIPLVIALSNDTSTWIFGPDTAAAVVGPISHAEQAERMLQTALDEPNGLAARRRITALFDAIASTAVAGRENFSVRCHLDSGLCTTHELATGVGAVRIGLMRVVWLSRFLRHAGRH